MHQGEYIRGEIQNSTTDYADFISSAPSLITGKMEWLKNFPIGSRSDHSTVFNLCNQWQKIHINLNEFSLVYSPALSQALVFSI